METGSDILGLAGVEGDYLIELPYVPFLSTISSLPMPSCVLPETDLKP